MTSGKVQMTLVAAVAALATVGGFAYIFVAHPAYLRETSAGVPYFAPAVVNPLGGPPLDLNMLVRHYEGKDQR